jgi:hypothetical protein
MNVPPKIDMIEATRLTRLGRLSEATALLRRGFFAPGPAADGDDSTFSATGPTAPTLDLVPSKEMEGPWTLAPNIAGQPLTDRPTRIKLARRPTATPQLLRSLVGVRLVGVMLGALSVSRLAQHFSERNKPQLGADAFPRMYDFGRGLRLTRYFLLKLADMHQPLMEGVLDFLDQDGLELRQIAGFNRMLCGWYDGSVVSARGLQPGIGRAFAGAVQPDDRFHKGLVGKDSRIPAETTHLARFLKGGANFGFGCRWSIGQYRIYVAIIQ